MNGAVLVIYIDRNQANTSVPHIHFIGLMSVAKILKKYSGTDLCAQVLGSRAVTDPEDMWLCSLTPFLPYVRIMRTRFYYRILWTIRAM